MQIENQISSKECYDKLVDDRSKSVLIDVRSKEEWSSEGVADFSALADADKVVLCEWRFHGSMEINEHFFRDLSKYLVFREIECLFFICAAGIRSKEAADYTRTKLKELGLQISCINVVDGFNGNGKSFFGFGEVNGWKAIGLPYRRFEKNSVVD